MAEIKIKKTRKRTIKTLNRAAVASQRLKTVCQSAKKQAERMAEKNSDAEESSAGAYAADQILENSKMVAQKSIREWNRKGKYAAQTTQKNISKAADAISSFRKNREIKAIRRNQANHPTIQRMAHEPQSLGSAAIRQKQHKTMPQPTVAKQLAHSERRSVKTAQATSKTVIKTTKQLSQIPQEAAYVSSQTARQTAQIAQTSAKKAITGIKKAVHAAISSVRSTLAATNALLTAVMAGGWIAVTVLVLVSLIGLFASSAFGIFFSEETATSNMTIQSAIQEINTECDCRLEAIINSTPHDVLELSGSRADWKEILAVYSVKTAADPGRPQEVATMDTNKKELLSRVFWEMTEIFFWTEEKTQTQTTEKDDGHRNTIQTEETITETYLYIAINHKSADDMATQYSFDSQQRQLLSELLNEEYDLLWTQLLYGIATSNGTIVAVALSQEGNIGGQPYWSWYGYAGRVEWCACFVSWCANECGYIESGVIPKFSGCDIGVRWFQEKDQWQESSYEPMAGQIIFFDWDGDGSSDHVGIVEKYENGVVHTIEGNSGDACRRQMYTVGSNVIYGYGIPAY